MKKNCDHQANGRKGKTVDRLGHDDRRYFESFERRCKLIRDRVRSVAFGYQNGAYIVGRPGSSKTYTVAETLRDVGVPHTCRNCHMTPAGLWAELKEHPEHVFVLDDIPLLHKQPQALQILMAALGGPVGEARLITYTTNAKKESFHFRGGIIAISNMPLSRDPLANAIASRVQRLQHEPTDEELMAVMRRLAAKGWKGLTLDECREVVEFIIQESQRNDDRLDLRTFDKGLQDRRQHKEGKAQSSWQDLIRSTMRQTVFDVRRPLLSKQEEIQLQLERVRELREKYPDDTGRQIKESGMSRSTFYARLRELTPANPRIRKSKNPEISDIGTPQTAA